MKKFYLLLLSIFIICYPVNASADSEKYDYTINSYEIIIDVKENNVMDITENIKVFFNTKKHGIYRKVPLSNNLSRLDGTSSKNLVRISNIDVNNNYTTSKDYKNLTIKIGDINKYFIGTQNYTIKYSYDIGKDPLKDKDELYLNLIGNNWDTIIDNITFIINMPKDFDKSKLGFSTGLQGEINNEDITYNVDKNIISGSLKHLDIGESLTVRCELPEDYFINESVIKVNYFIIIIPLLLVIVCIFLWEKYGKDKAVVDSVEFYPPNKLNSLDIAYLYNGEITKKDVLSLLIYLANKGYLEISDKKIDVSNKKVKLGKDSEKNVSAKIKNLKNKISNEKKLNPTSKKIRYYENMLNIYENIYTPIDYKKYDLDKKSFKRNGVHIKKIKDYDGNNQIEKIFMEGLFSYDNDVDINSLYNNFYITVNRIIKLEEHKYENIIFEKENKFIKNLMKIFILIIMLCVTLLPIFTYRMYELLLPITTVSIIGTFILMAFLLGKNEKFLNILYILFGTIFAIIPWCYYMSSIIRDNNIYLLSFTFGIIFSSIIGFLYKHMKKKTDYGIKMIGRIKGFKRFLVTVEADKLEELVNENSKYFYDILPYTYVLGISDKWFKKFESIIMQSPEWFNSDNNFNYNSFNKFLNNTTRTSTSYNSYSSSFSSSSSSSGGGYSGGGSGGGGGGSW